MPNKSTPQPMVSKSSETLALEAAYDRGWYWVLEQLDKAFVDDATMLNRAVYKAKARTWSKTANPMQVAANLGGIVSAVEAIVLEDWELKRITERVEVQCGLRDRLAESLGIQLPCDWRSGLSAPVVRRKVHYMWTVMAGMKLCRPPPFDPYSRRLSMDDPTKQAHADANAEAWVS